MDKFFDFGNPIYRPLWVRVLIVGLTGGWGIFEFLNGSPFWGTLFAGTCALTFHAFFIAFNARKDEPADKKGKPE